MSLSSIGVSGMQAASLTMGVAAHNIANVQTPGFRRQSVQAQTQPEGGVTVTISAAASGAEGDSLATDLVAERVALHSFEANLATVRAADAMLGTLLDARA